MKIYFERSGGFMGRMVARTIDVTTLPRETADSLMLLVQQNDFFGKVEKASPPAAMGMPVYDQFHFRVTIETAQGERRTVEVGDQSAPPEMQPLLHELSQLARKPQSAYDALMEAEAQEVEEPTTEFVEEYPPPDDYSPDDF